MSHDEEVKKINEKKFEELLKQQKLQKSRQEPSVKPVELTDANFVQTVKNHPLVVVDFWAPWCGPCRMVSPVLEELASEMVGLATFGKLNVDDNPTISQQFEIQGIPTIVVFKDGEPVDGLVGAAPKQMIEARIRPYVSGSEGAPYQ
ncbi:MAG: thioredoxin [Nitrososphaerota archaeon]|nr:thioredoxin [Nitrososphaerota archaeon]MDG7030305.1 thioredoxin [Nitrososphaerota archaeon]